MTAATLLDAAQTLELPLTGINLIEASAGTGKTHTIANLYLRHLLEGRPLREILVVSFTNAATDELRQRIHLRLQQALQVLTGGTPGDDDFLQLLAARHESLAAELRQRDISSLRLALRSLDEAMITTIHGFCHAALSDHALLSGRRFDSDICADDEADWKLALGDWWRKTAYPLPAAEWTLLRQALPRFDDLLDWQQRLRSHPQDRLLPEVDTPLAELLAQHAAAEADARLLHRIRARALAEAHAFARRQVAARKHAEGRLAYQDQLELLLEALTQPAGEHLARRLRARFPVALVDEFQDTDPLQYGIFKTLYFGQEQTGLTLIGDPKQAIYGFRGGDIFTYIRLKAETGLRLFALQTNWRSQPGLVAAVNQLFGMRAAPFIYEPAIDFSPAAAAERNRDAGLTCAGEPASAFCLWRLPLRDNGKTFGVGEMRERINHAVAAEIVRLLDPQTRAQVDGRPLRSGDIAILVRDRDEGEALRGVLHQAGVRAVSIGREKVFLGAEARALYLLLDGIAHCFDDASLRRACSSGLLDLDYRELAATIDDDSRWQQWIDLIQGLHATWANGGFIAMFEQMMQKLDLGTALAQRDTAERRLTNLVHLAELLQQQSRLTPGMDALLTWLRRQMHDGGGDEAELRLESDSALVNIVTVHKSKGLEYPVVFLPFAWRCRLASKNARLVRFHDSDCRAFLDLGSDDFAQHACLAERERLAEDLRLLYVGVTRARARLYLAWGDVGDGRSKGQPKHSALGYLLHSRQTPQDLEHDLPDAFSDAAAVDADLHSLARQCPAIELTPLPAADAAAAAVEPATERARLKPARMRRNLGTAWRINSFSGLTRDLHQPAPRSKSSGEDDPILDFPAGSHIGLLLHRLLEHLDFARPIEPQAGPLIEQLAPAYGITSEAQRQTLCAWLRAIVDTRLDADGLCLGQVTARRRLNELKFDFALDRLDVAALNDLLQQAADAPLTVLTAVDFRGLLTGVIDLVFEHRGRYYLADYKSNFLGGRLDDYTPERLQQAMHDRRYDLQALIYSLALHRYLAQRLPDYSYARHYGGCYYLFLRAMRPASGARFGVHFEAPDQRRLDKIERLFAFTPSGAAVA